MPTNLFVHLNCNSKILRLFIFLLLIPVFLHSQSLTGLWIGSLSNDSTTVRQDQSFEIALTEYKGKVYGYSRSEFIVEDVLYYVVKRVKGTIEGNVCEVEDDEIIAFNFPRKLDKGIKVTSTFRKNISDGVWQLEGTWKTNATKKYYAVTGKVGLEEEKDLTASKIFPHLEELKLAKDIAFYKEREEGIPIVKIAKPEKIKTENSKIGEVLTQQTGTMAAINKPVLIETAPVEELDDLPGIKKSEGDLPKTKTKNISEGVALVKPAAAEVKALIVVTQTPTEEKTIAKTIIEKPESIKKEMQQVKMDKPIAKQETVNANNKQKQDVSKSNIPLNATPVLAQTKKEPLPANAEKPFVKTETSPKKQTEIVKKQEVNVINTKGVVNDKQEEKSVVLAKPIPLAIKKTTEEITNSAAVISGRKSEFSQEVNYKSDSLILSLYDNGEIDGDTVSVFLNGKILMARQGLKASAIKHTIYISPETEDFSLVLFAENLGKYPPNTGLLVVRDGDEVYNLRFSSDFQKNAGIVFRRKKN